MMTYMFNGECDNSIKQAFIESYGPQPNDKLRFIIETTTDYKKSGIYSAQRDDTSKPVVIDWGDGTVEQVNGDVSQKVHEYASVGTFNVVVENIKSYAASTSLSDWYAVNSQNQYTLKEVEAFPDSMSSLESYSFYKCASLVDVSMPKNIVSIDANAFYQCSGLTDVFIPNYVTSIGVGAFQNCSYLSNVIISDSVVVIKEFAFLMTTNLKKLTIGSNISTIERDAFNTAARTHPTDIYIKDLAKWCNIYLSSSAFYNYNLYLNNEKITELIISSDITDIKKNTFKSCQSLTSITILDSVSSIEGYAFQECNSLVNVSLSNSIASIGSGAFQNCRALTSMTIGSSITSIGANAFQKCSNLKSMQIDRTVDYVQSLSNYSWNLPTGCSITCTDGTIVI